MAEVDISVVGQPNHGYNRAMSNRLEWLSLAIQIAAGAYIGLLAAELIPGWVVFLFLVGLGGLLSLIDFVKRFFAPDNTVDERTVNSNTSSGDGFSH